MICFLAVCIFCFVILCINGTMSAFVLQVFCEMSRLDGRTVIQKHNGNNSLAFDRIWNDYKDGFGNLTGEHWLGLDKMYLLTNQPCRCTMLNISLGAFSGELAYAYYDSFSVGHANISYKISLGKYTGSAGDALRGLDDKDIDNNVEGSLFSTQDKDNDNCSPCLRGDVLFSSCARDFGSGWWFNKCAVSNLNGKWRPQTNSIGWRAAVSWKKWKDNESLKFSVMYVINQ
uniref:Fibrinogen C-terminal domain-containing protein n=1 Tax=Leptobrachium leishanense TaxID=445787 RepID=A0A8C5MC17_9ANUR